MKELEPGRNAIAIIQYVIARRDYVNWIKLGRPGSFLRYVLNLHLVRMEVSHGASSITEVIRGFEVYKQNTFVPVMFILGQTVAAKEQLMHLCRSNFSWDEAFPADSDVGVLSLEITVHRDSLQEQFVSMETALLIHQNRLDVEINNLTDAVQSFFDKHRGEDSPPPGNPFDWDLRDLKP